MSDIFDELDREHAEAPWCQKARWAISRVKVRFHPIKSFKWRRQRAYRGFSNEDWWSFDSHLARVIAAGCRKFIAEGHGYPMFPEETAAWETSQGNAQETAESLRAQFPADEQVARWNKILDEIASGFEGYADGEASSVVDAQNPAFKRAMSLFAEWFPALWD